MEAVFIRRGVQSREIEDTKRGLDSNGWSRWTSLVLTVSLRLRTIGHRLSNRAQSQVERFVGRALRQIAEDTQTMPAHPVNITQLVWHLDSLVRAIETRRVSSLFQALAALFHVIHSDGEVAGYSTPRTNPGLYRPFEAEAVRYLSYPVDTVAFVGFLSRWRTIALKGDAFLFLLLRVLDAFRRPLFQIQYAGIENEARMNRITQWTLTYLDGLKGGDYLCMYRSLSFLITELQLLTEMESEELYLVPLESHRHEAGATHPTEIVPQPGLLRGLVPVGTDYQFATAAA